MEHRYRTVKDGLDLSYLVLTPDDVGQNEKLPLVVSLHGVGTYGDDPEVLAEGVAYKAYYKFTPRAILMIPHSRFEPWSTQIHTLKAVIDEVADRFHADMTRISLIGASMGGYGTWEMLCSFPSFFSCGVVICGGGMAFRAPSVTHLPIRLYHGDKDTTVLPARAEEMLAAVRHADPEADIRLTVCENVAHDSWNRAYLEDNILAWMIEQQRRTFDVYAGGPVKGSGIYHYRLTDGKMTLCEKTEDEGVMYMKIKNGKLYALFNEPCGNREGGVCRYDLRESRLVARSPIFPTFGKAACHLDVDDDEAVYCVNYLSGNVIKIDMARGATSIIRHTGDGPNKPRQDKTHTHQALLTPDGLYFTVCDLGTDTIHVYDKSLREVSRVQADAGSGPRHIAFSDDGTLAYCVNELSNTVTVYGYHDGVLTKKASYDMLPFGYDGLTTAAAIRVCGGFVYASTRGHDSITRFAIDGDKLRFVDNTPCGGTRPRDFAISPDGKTLVCANEGGTLTVFTIAADGSLKQTPQTFEVPGALAVLIV